MRFVSVSLLIVASIVGDWSASGMASASRGPAASVCGAWTVVPSPNVGSNGSVLAGVAAVSMTGAWAVGSSFTGSTYQTLAEHWDGSSWSLVPTQNTGTGENVLTAVSVVSASDVWAVGFYDDGSTFRTLAEHWDGSLWSVVPTPNVGGGGNALPDVAAV